MNLYLLRHAIAVERGTPGYDDDSARPLTKRGEKKMYEAARGMKTLGLKFDVILSSPFARARHTADIVAEVLGEKKKLVLVPSLQPDADPSAVMQEIHARYNALNDLLLVGHEPYLGTLLTMLLAGGGPTAVTMKKGGLCALSVENPSYTRCATLLWLMTPGQLRAVNNS